MTGMMVILWQLLLLVTPNRLPHSRHFAEYLIVTIPTKRYDYSHFTDRKTEVQRGQVIYTLLPS